jgi:asparagine synthase (glutamine-hydrolysing)
MKPFVAIFFGAASTAFDSAERCGVHKFLSELGWGCASVVAADDAWLAQSVGRGRTHLPAATPSPFSIAFDGWLENYDELIDALHLRESRHDICDADIVAAAYRRWGQDTPQHLYGEYSAVIWTAATRHLFVFRDRTGIRPLYFSTLSEGGIAFATLPGALTLINDVANVFNETAVAEYLNGREIAGIDTLYKNVFRFPGGHQMSWRRGTTASPTRYWIPSSKRFRHSDKEIVEEFGLLLTKVTRAASRSKDSVYCDVSGGVDSSSVATVLGTLVEANNLLCPSIEAHSLVYPGLECDESAYIQQVQAKLPFNLHTHPPKPPALHDLDNAIKRLRYPYRALSLWGRDQYVVKKGGSVILTGHGGDELFSPTEFAFREALGTASTMAVVAARIARRWRHGKHARSFYGRAYVALLEIGGWRLGRLGHRYVMRNGQRPPEIDESWCRATNWPARTAPTPMLRHARVVGCDLASSGFLGAAMEWLAMHGALYGLEYRHPLCSATLIEFANRLPVHLLDGFAPFTRWPMRAALRGRLPEAVATRTDKAEFTEPNMQGMWPLWDEQLAATESKQMKEKADPRRWRYYLDRNAQYCWPPLAALSVNQWFEQGLTSHPMGLPVLEVLR